MTKTYRALAALLDYPQAELIEALPELKRAFSGNPGVLSFLEEFGKTPLPVLQERYVALFDRSRALSLHLFEHVHGESRDRGQAMVDLQAMYAGRGLHVAGGELPDYLPAFLEYLSVLEKDEVAKMLRDTTHILRAIGEALARCGSPYAEVFSALLALAGEPGIEIPAAARREAEELTESPESREALDRAWMEAPVTFMGGQQPAGGPQPVKFYARGARP